MSDILTNDQAASYLGYSPQTLLSSRSRGILAGIEAPKYIKVGRTIRYRKADLEEWIAQFEYRTETEKAIK